MLPFSKVKEMLNKHGHQYTDEEIKLIREFVSILIDIDYNLFLRRQEEELFRKQSGKIIKLNTDNEKGNSIHPGEYRRAS